MPSLAITGTIGSGKTSALDLVVSVLKEAGYSSIRFSADEENRRLLTTDPETKQLVVNLLGAESFRPDGEPDREMIFRSICANSETRNQLENILHPRIERIWKPLAESHRSLAKAFFVAEIPLLYEKSLEGFFDKVLVVGCSDHQRKERLLTNRSVKSEKAKEWLSLQQSQEEKLAKADHLLWNDGTLDSLKQQIQTLLQSYLKP
jgi:dephospho-CoA kinase